MNGAEAVLRTLTGSGVSLCLANPGTSEMHMVAALDEAPRMRPAPGLFEGAATGAADGHGRVTRRPAAAARAAAVAVGPGPGGPGGVIAAAAALRGGGGPGVIMLGGPGMPRPALDGASRIAQAPGARLIAETFPARQERGAGIPPV